MTRVCPSARLQRWVTEMFIVFTHISRLYKRRLLWRLLAVKREQWPGLGRIPARLSCWPQFFHAVINPADNARLWALFSQDPQHTATHSDGVTQVFTTEPLCLKQSKLAGRVPQLVHILVKRSASPTAITDFWGCARVCSSVFWKRCSEKHIYISIQGLTTVAGRCNNVIGILF